MLSFVSILYAAAGVRSRSPVALSRSCCRLRRLLCAPLHPLTTHLAPKNNIHPLSSCRPRQPTPRPRPRPRPRQQPKLTLPPTAPTPPDSLRPAPQCSVSRLVRRFGREAHPHCSQQAPHCSTRRSSHQQTPRPSLPDRLVTFHHGLGRPLLIAHHQPALGHTPKFPEPATGASITKCTPTPQQQQWPTKRNLPR